MSASSAFLVCISLILIVTSKVTLGEEERVSHGGHSRILESPQVFNKREGEDVMLPCRVNQPSESPILWRRKSGKVLFAGVTDIEMNVRIKLGNQTSDIFISSLKQEDSGSYTCSIGNDLKNSVTHELNVLSLPRIMSWSPNKTSKVINSSREHVLELSCNASGNPQPEISWIWESKVKQEDRELSRVLNIVGHTLKIDHVDPRSDSGRYICKATNAIGEDSKFWDVDILFAPQIELDNDIVHAGKNSDTVITCRVYGNPSPKVTWTREVGSRTFSESDSKFILKREADQASLTIRDCNQDDFSSYSCIANNDLGMNVSKIDLVGVPLPPRITSEPQIRNPAKFYIASWETISNYDMVAYKLAYRRKFFNETSQEPGHWTLVNLEPFDNELSPNEVRADINNYVHSRKFKIQDLDLDTKYELQVEAQNENGWSRESELFEFELVAENSLNYSNAAARGVNSIGLMAPLVMILIAIFHL